MMSSEVQTVTVPHLGSSTIGYKFGKPYDASLPTLVLVNSFTTSVEQYRPQFADETLSSTANLLALEPYGHGQTRASYEQFTYWDSPSPTCRPSTRSASPRRSCWARRRADG
jgi:hypothetical protein